MRKTAMVVLSTLALCFSASAQEQAAKLPTADEVIARSIEAHGGLAKMKAINSMRMTGRMTVGPGMEAPIVLESKRPNQSRMDITFQGMTASQVYDNGTGWQIMPFQGKTDPEPLSGDDLKDAEENADIDGPFVDYKAKGHQVEMAGKENVEGADCFKLKLTKKNGDVRYYFIDAESYLPIKFSGKRMVRGTEVETEASLGDYKEVAGVWMPHVMEVGAKDSPVKQKLTVVKVEVNVPLDAERFKMPAPKPKPEEKPVPKPPVR